LKISDFDRPLNQRGKEEAAIMAQRLVERGACPDALISSSAKRARKTAELVAGKINFPGKKITYADLAYTSDTIDLLQVVRKIEDNIGSAFLIGHNYAITDLAVLLTGEYIKKIPTSGVVAMDLDVSSWLDVGPNKGSLLFFDFPERKKKTRQ